MLRHKANAPRLAAVVESRDSHSTLATDKAALQINFLEWIAVGAHRTQGNFLDAPLCGAFRNSDLRRNFGTACDGEPGDDYNYGPVRNQFAH